MIEKSDNNKFSKFLTEKSKEKFCENKNLRNYYNNFRLKDNNFSCDNTSLSYLESIGILEKKQEKELIETIGIVIFFETLLKGEIFNTQIKNVKIVGNVDYADKKNPIFDIQYICIKCKDSTIIFLQDEKEKGREYLIIGEPITEIIFYFNKIQNTRELLLLRYLDELYHSYGISKDMITTRTLPQIRQLIEIIKV